MVAESVVPGSDELGSSPPALSCDAITTWTISCLVTKRGGGGGVRGVILAQPISCLSGLPPHDECAPLQATLALDSRQAVWGGMLGTCLIRVALTQLERARLLKEAPTPQHNVGRVLWLAHPAFCSIAVAPAV